MRGGEEREERRGEDRIRRREEMRTENSVYFPYF